MKNFVFDVHYSFFNLPCCPRFVVETMFVFLPRSTRSENQTCFCQIAFTIYYIVFAANCPVCSKISLTLEYSINVHCKLISQIEEISVRDKHSTQITECVKIERASLILKKLTILIAHFFRMCNFFSWNRIILPSLSSIKATTISLRWY